MTDAKDDSNPYGKESHDSHRSVDQAGLDERLVMRIGRLADDIKYGAVNGRFPTRTARRIPKDGQLFNIGAMTLHVLSKNAEFLEALNTTAKASNLTAE